MINLLETIAEAALPILAALPGANNEELLGEYSGIAPSDAAQIHDEMIADLASEPDYARFMRLRTLAGGESGALVLDCALSCAVYPELDALMERACDGGCSLSVNGQMQQMNPSDYAALYRQHQCLKKLLPLKQSGGLFLRDRFQADERLLNHIAGLDVLPERLSGAAELFDPSSELQALYVGQKDAERVRALLSVARPLQIAGEAGRGKRLLLRHALKAEGRWGVFVDAAALARRTDGLDLLWLIRREALLLDAVVCLYGIDEAWQNSYENTHMRQMLDALDGAALCFATDKTVRFACGQTADWERMELGELTLEDCVSLWSGYCTQLGVKGLDARVLGAKYRLNPAQIAKAARCIAAAPEPTPDVLLQACLDAMPPASGNIRLVRAHYTFDDLKVSAQTRQVLDNICAHVNEREKVYVQWGLEKRYAYGRSISALFSGSPGTGKTMAAHVLSTALSLPLYCVNLSQVVDKYIGETEKKLEQIFTLAERSSSILFFDEADSLFGKRSEVNDSKDRYANIEVSYILQRLEQYEGIVILATNNRSNMDDAFLRRIRFITDFQMPDENLRRQIWEGCFDESTPLGDVDLDFIANKFQFSGGDIKNVALNAAFLAAQSGAEAIGMEHILQSIRLEYLKTNRVLMANELGEYAYLLF